MIIKVLWDEVLTGKWVRSFQGSALPFFSEDEGNTLF
jgi:hypothetical protein